MKTHKDLTLWKESIRLVAKIYKITNDYPAKETFGITDQIRRASVSIPSNIAEGAGRNSKKEFIRFLYIALGSLSELETQLIIAELIGYSILDNELKTEIKRINMMIHGLIRKLKQ